MNKFRNTTLAARLAAKTRASQASRTLAQPGEPGGGLPQPEPSVRATGTSRIFTAFTTPDGVAREVFASSTWTRVYLILQSAGPVDVGDKPAMDPVLSGKGETLLTGVPWEVDMAPGQRLYLISNTVDRVSVRIQPIAWQEQMALSLETISAVAGNIFRLIARAISR